MQAEPAYCGRYFSGADPSSSRTKPPTALRCSRRARNSAMVISALTIARHARPTRQLQAVLLRHIGWLRY